MRKWTNEKVDNSVLETLLSRSRLFSDIQRFAGSAEQIDDMVMLALKYYGPNGAADRI